MVTRLKDEELEAFGQAGFGKNQLVEQKANMAYLQRHYKRLLKDYPNNWVIINGGGGQVFFEEDPEKFEERLERIRSTGAVTYFLAYPEPVMLL